MASSSIVEYPIFMGKDAKLAKHLKEETTRLGLVNIETSVQSQENTIVHHIKKFTFNFIQSLVQDPSVSLTASPFSTPTTTTPTRVHEGNFKAIVEQLQQQNVKKKLALDPNTNLTFMSIVVKNKNDTDRVDVDWFIKFDYTAKEIWPHVLNQSEEGKKLGVYPTMKEIVTIGKFRASHLANRKFMDSSFFFSFVNYYRISHTTLHDNLKVKTLKKLVNLGFSVEELKAMGVCYSTLTTTWGMTEQDEDLFGFELKTWKSLGKPDTVKKSLQNTSTKSKPILYSFEKDEDD